MGNCSECGAYVDDIYEDGEWNGEPETWSTIYYGRTLAESLTVARRLGLTDEQGEANFWFISHVDSDKRYLTDPEFGRMYNTEKKAEIAKRIEDNQERPHRLYICCDYPDDEHIEDGNQWYVLQGMECPMMCSQETHYAHGQQGCEGCTRNPTQIRGPDHFDYGDHMESRVRANFNIEEDMWEDEL